MSILTVEHLSHGFGDRAIFQDVSFRMLKGEHIGLVGANGEGKSTFFNIITGAKRPDEGKIEWAKNIKIGYLDQHTVLEKGLSIRDVLKSAFADLFEMEIRMNTICEQLCDADEGTMNSLMEELGVIQDTLTLRDFYLIDSKVDEIARAFGLTDIGLDKDVTDLSGGQRTRILLGKLLLQKPDILLLDEPTNYLDEEHISWLKRYLTEYENAFVLISHDIPFLNDVVNIIYHVENQELTRYVGNYEDFQKVYDEIHKEKKNATLDKSNNYEVVPSQNNISFDVKEAQSQYDACELGGEIEIPLSVEEPEVTTEKLKSNLFTTELASYSTTGGGSEGRRTNISLAVKSCNGVILLPGETFSYNDTLGERTADKGYQPAGAYSDGEVVE